MEVRTIFGDSGFVSPWSDETRVLDGSELYSERFCPNHHTELSLIGDCWECYTEGRNDEQR